MSSLQSLPSIYVRSDPNLAERLEKKLAVPPFLARVLANRNIQSPADLQLERKHLLTAGGILNIDTAAQRVVDAILKDQHIVIASDFDTDGATSTALCVSFLQAVGAKYVSYRVPNRQTMGYGLTPEFVQSILPSKPELIVTVDNGISSQDGVALANHHGVDVVITDHHLPPETLPRATAIVNPNMPGNGFESKPAGVGVAFYLLTAVRKHLQEIGYFVQQNIEYPNLAEWLDLVAVGTIADLVPLDRNNRALIKQGMDRIKAGAARPGIQALMGLDNKPSELYTAEDVGFKIAPKINAAGRLEDMTVGIQTLLSTDLKSARKLAQELDGINKKRREIQKEMTDVASVLANAQHTTGERSLCVFDQSFHEGVVGLVASRLVETHNCPCIAFAESSDDGQGLLKGSARSIEGVHIRDVLSDMNARYPHLIERFGGHAMAAGLTLKKGQLRRFSKLFEQSVDEVTEDKTFVAELWSDGELDPSWISLETVAWIEQFEPWGADFPYPVFHGSFKILDQRELRNRVLRLKLAQDRYVFQAVAFNQDRIEQESISCTYRLSRNFFRDRSSMQMVIQKIAGSIQEY